MDKRVRRHVTGRVRKYFSITTPGFEDICRQELLDLGMDASAIAVESGGVAFAGRFVDCQQANLCLRTATRILMRIHAFSATNPRQLQRQSAAIPWELFLSVGANPDMKVSSRRSRLYHTEGIAWSVQEGISQRWDAIGASPSSVFPQTVFVRLVDDWVTLSLDSSGDALFKRGMKEGPARAPIRESLAAAILTAAGYDSRRPLVDPLCGSGSFSLEAAMMAKQMAPGVKRRFAFMDWPAFRGGQWAYLKREAQSKVKFLKHPRIYASDVDAAACNQLVGTVVDSGLSDAVQVMKKDVFDCEAGQYGGGPGLVTINPPYGIRIGSPGQADDLFKRICRHLVQAFKGWDVALIAPHRHLVLGLPFPVRQMPLVHGGLRLTLILGNIK